MLSTSTLLFARFLTILYGEWQNLAAVSNFNFATLHSKVANKHLKKYLKEFQIMISIPEIFYSPRMCEVAWLGLLHAILRTIFDTSLVRYIDTCPT